MRTFTSSYLIALTLGTFTSASAVAIATQAAEPTNPYLPHCPVPSTFTISDFRSVTNLLNSSDPINDASFRISFGSKDLAALYGDGSFYCPRKGSVGNFYDGKWALLCDNNGMVLVYTDGFSSVDLRQWHFCDQAPKNGKYFYGAIETNAHNVNISSKLTCSTNQNIRTCTQLERFVVPVQQYLLGGVMGYQPLDQNGVELLDCPSLGPGHQNIVVDPASCTHGLGSI